MIKSGDAPPLPVLLIATSNSGKVREIRVALAGLPVALKLLTDFPKNLEPEETGRTFAENALVKALYYCARVGLPTVAEDSGLVIDVLRGRPGVESARYPGETYADKFANLYRELSAFPRPWAARFVCSLALVDPDHARLTTEPETAAAAASVLYACEASVDGEISPEPRGSGGFGYDPIFYYPPYGCTLGEVSDEEKAAVSHRAKAFRQLRQAIVTTRGLVRG